MGRLLPLFKVGLGGRVGSGKQYWSWVALSDVARAIEHALETPQVSGAVNVVSPNPVTNAEFTATLARILSRPAIFPAPAFALRAMLGGMADELLLASQRAQPAQLLRSGFRFQLAELEGAFRALLRR
jgi:uncharacterized protein (TIGR01777 family)